MNENKSKAKKAKSCGRTSGDNILGMYLKEINRIPLLTREEENETAREAAKGNLNARNKLINSNLRFVVNVAKRYQGLGFPLSDLISEGNIGLISAIERFDINRGYHFISYAVWWIRQAILKALCEKARLIRLPANRASELIQIQKARRAVAADCSPENEISEIARILKMDKNEIEDLIAISKEAVSLETMVYSDTDASRLECLIEDKRCTAPDHDLIQKDLEYDVNGILDTLDEKEANIIRLRYGFGNHSPMSLTELGDHYNLSKERIRQIEKKAIGHLRQSNDIAKLETYVA
jgi:RNA polymerase primary sigma factor